MPKDELVGKSSLEVKAMLMNTPGSNDSDEQDFESSAYEHKDDSGESEPERKAESPEAYSKRLWQENQEEEAQRRREEAVEQQQASLEYLEKESKQQVEKSSLPKVSNRLRCQIIRHFAISISMRVLSLIFLLQSMPRGKSKFLLKLWKLAMPHKRIVFWNG